MENHAAKEEVSCKKLAEEQQVLLRVHQHATGGNNTSKKL